MTMEKRKSHMKIELFDDAVEALKKIGLITDRRADEVIADALRLYLWALHQQTFGKQIISKNTNVPCEGEMLTPLVTNEEESRTFFEKMGW